MMASATKYLCSGMGTISRSMMVQHIKEVTIAARSLSGTFFMVKYFQSALSWQNLDHDEKVSLHDGKIKKKISNK